MKKLILAGALMFTVVPVPASAQPRLEDLVGGMAALFLCTCH
jgi:hypothetical protein